MQVAYMTISGEWVSQQILIASEVYATVWSKQIFPMAIWDPNDHILCKTDIPKTSLGRFYSILEHYRKLSEEQLLSVKQ